MRNSLSGQDQEDCEDCKETVAEEVCLVRFHNWISSLPWEGGGGEIRLKTVPQMKSASRGMGGGRGCFSCESFLRWKLIIKLLTEFGCKIVWRRTWKEEKISVVIGMQTFQVKNLIILQSRINLAYCDRTGHCKPLLILSNLNSPPISHWVICAQKKVLKAIKVDFELCVSPIFIAIIALTRFIYLISISRVCRCAACHLLSIANLYKTVLKKIITKLCELCL